MMLQSSRCLILLLFCFSISLGAQAATFTITPDGSNFQLIDGVSIGAAPGDVIEVEAGTYGELLFRNITGSIESPVQIINRNGQVLCDSDGNSGITLMGCRYVRLTGTGSGAVQYGFKVGTDYDRNGAHGIQSIGGSSDIEVDHTEVFSAGFAGFNVKDEVRVDGLYNRGNFLMQNIELHHNYVHDTRGEGFYIGHTFYNGLDIGGTLYYPHLIRNLKIYNNHTLRTGTEGIQVGSTIAGMEVYDNLVEDPGIDPFANFQSNGIQIGFSEGIVLGNTIRDARDNGIIVLSPGNVTIACNVIERPHTNGMFLDDRAATEESILLGGSEMGPGFRIVSNTIIDPGQTTDPNANPAGILLYADVVTDTNYVYNNLFVGGAGESRTLVTLNGNVPVEEAGSTWAATTSGLGLVDPANGDYRLSPGSPLINQGVGVQQFGVFRDHADNGRTAGSASDIGAFEFPEAFTADALNDSIEGEETIPYRLFIPDSAGVENPLPLVIFLHGFGERGAVNNFDNKRQVQRHISSLIRTVRGPRYASFLLAPQSPGSWGGGGDDVVQIVNTLMAEHTIDSTRIYVTGLSDGGKGTWQTLAEGGELFAAGVPLSAVSSRDTISAIAQAKTPIWAFHGDADTVVGPGSTRVMINGLLSAGSLPRYTERVGWRHSNWNSIYNESTGWTDFYANGDPNDRTLELYAWLFKQQRFASTEEVVIQSIGSGDTLLFDFGDGVRTDSPDNTGRYWNHVPSVSLPTGSENPGLILSNGAQTEALLRITDGFIGTGNSGVSEDTFFPSSAQRDHFFSGSGRGHDAGLADPGAIRIEGLPADTVCRVSIFGSRRGLDANGIDRLTRYTIGSESQDIETVDNASSIAVFESVLTDALGQLDIEVAVSPLGTGRFCYISALEIEVDPEIEVGAFTRPSDGDFRLSFRSRKGWRYQLQQSSTLETGSWINVPSVMPLLGNGMEQSIDWVQSTEDRMFYRILDIEP